MKRILFVLPLMAQSLPAFAKIIVNRDRVFLHQSGHRVPISMVNELIQKRAVNKLRLYERGDVHIMSFSKGNEPEKLYSVDQKGFVYALEPFSKFQVKDIDRQGKIQFAEQPGKRYRVNSKGLFVL